MASQPLNSSISVSRRVRAQMVVDRSCSVKHLTGEMMPRIAIVPGDEIRVAQTRDNLVTDAWRWGHPLVRVVKSQKTPDVIYQEVENIDHPIRLTAQRRDLFVEKVAGHEHEDLYGEAANA